MRDNSKGEKSFSKNKAGQGEFKGKPRQNNKTPKRQGAPKRGDSKKAFRNGGFKKAGSKPHDSKSFAKPFNRQAQKHNSQKEDDFKKDKDFNKPFKSNAGRKAHKPNSKDGFKKSFDRPFSGDFKGRRPHENGGHRKNGKAFAHERKPFRQPLKGKAREAAWDAADRVLIDGGYSAITLSDVLNDLNIDERDKRLCTRIVYLTLEKLNYIDFALGYVIKEPEKLPPTLINLLRISAAQLFFLDRVPASAVVDEAVNLARKKGFEELTSLVNGVLRSLIRKKDEIVFPKKTDNLREYLSICGSASLELVDTLIANFGEDTAEKIIMFSDRGFSMTVRRNMMRLTRIEFEELVKSKPWKKENGVLPYVYRVSGTDDISQDPDFRNGLFSIQGEGSMLAALAVKADLGMNVLDCCAAPGGKSMFMAERMQGTGRVQAWDIHEKRVQLIRASSERLRLYNVRPMVRDALVFRENLVSSMDAVLLDAPCTGTGVMASKPESKYRFNSESLKELCKIQRDMLDTVSAYLKTGGRLVYSTCSILPEENTRQIESFLSRHKEFKILPFDEDFPEILRNKATPCGLQLMPGEDGMQEGFFIAAMEKTSDE